MSLAVSLHGYRFYEGSAALAADLVPGRFPVALAGRPYPLDEASQEHLQRSIPLLKPQQDVQNATAEASLNPEGLWRRGQDSWHHGAGQTYLDRPESDNQRFRSSKGIDVWNRWEISLLWDTTSKRTSANTNLQLLRVGDHLYVLDGNEAYFTLDITAGTPTFTAANIAAGEGSVTATSMATDGYNVWVALGTNGVHTTTRGATASTSYNDLQATVVGFANGRLMAAKDNAVYNITASGAAPTALFTHSNSDWRWVGFAEGPKYIYMAGFSGNVSQVHKVTVKSDGSGLDVPTTATPAFDGEVITAIVGYAGWIVLGTDKGWRFCTIDGAGDLEIGSRINTTSAVKAFEGQDNFIWYGLTNYDNSSTGLGRMDPGIITGAGSLTPAWASDLMATAQGEITAIATFQNRRLFAVAGSGIWLEDQTQRVASGTIDSGLITYGTPDPKVAVFLDTRYRSLPAGSSHLVYLADATGTFSALGTHTAGGNTDQFGAGQVRSEFFEIRNELRRSTTTVTNSPILIRHTLKSEVAADVGNHHFVPLLLTESWEDFSGQPVYMSPGVELEFIRDLRRNRTVVIYQEGSATYSVTVDDYQWAPHHRTSSAPWDGYWNGTCVCKLKEIA